PPLRHRSVSPCLPPAPRRPPRSPPLPYTTLFRSAPHAAAPGQPAASPATATLNVATTPSPEPSKKKSVFVAMQGRRRRGSCRLSDRKSTRLNSSHVEISYAVFCLKRKVNKTQ